MTTFFLKKFCGHFFRGTYRFHKIFWNICRSFFERNRRKISKNLSKKPRKFVSNEKNVKTVILFLHTFQNIAHHLAPKTTFEGGREAVCVYAFIYTCMYSQHNASLMMRYEIKKINLIRRLIRRLINEIKKISARLKVLAEKRVSIIIQNR